MEQTLEKNKNKWLFQCSAMCLNSEILMKNKAKSFPEYFFSKEAFFCGFLGLALNLCQNIITTRDCNVQSFTAYS